MIYGAITNSWRLQLESEELLALVGQARARGARHIELRQTCLGALASLAKATLGARPSTAWLPLSKPTPTSPST